jgi:tRNA(fMet)-specific endonuclease VapC
MDTSAYSHFKRGHAPAVEILSHASRVGVPAVVLGELRSGFGLGRQATRNEAELRKFLAQPVVTVLDIDDDASAIYAELVVELRRAGTPLPTNDIWIAAVAAREGAAVLTYDAHFTSIPRVATRLLTH